MLSMPPTSTDNFHRPVSINALTCGSLLLIAGSLCDVFGAKVMYLFGTLLQVAFAAAAGASRTGLELILFRGLSGIATSFTLPSAVSIITTTFVGQTQLMAFACFGAGQPVGFAFGLVFGGVFTNYVNRRLGFYISAGVVALNAGLAAWAIPEDEKWTPEGHQILKKIDWVGALIACCSFTMSSFVFAEITGSTLAIRKPYNITFLVLSCALVPVFVVWVDRQERLGRPALIPNSLWLNRHFAVTCMIVFLGWGSFNGLETMLTLYFQNAQGISALHTSLYFLPSAIISATMQILSGKLVHRVSSVLVVGTGLFLSCIAPLLMTFAQKDSHYWTFSLYTTILNPVGVAGFFTVANLLITASFPGKTKGLAGGVFNTTAQVGKSFGIAVVALVASSFTRNSHYPDKGSPEALMAGYHAAFWCCFGIGCLTLALSLIGLCDIGMVGKKAVAPSSMTSDQTP